MIVHAKEFIRPFINKIPKNFVITDEMYFCPTKEILIKEIYPKYKNWLVTLKLFRWSHKWDCENFSDSFKLFSSGYYEQNIESNADSISIGTVFLKINHRSHAINIIYLNDNNKLTMIFLEPQTGEIINLNQEQLDSIFFLYI